MIAGAECNTPLASSHLLSARLRILSRVSKEAQPNAAANRWSRLEGALRPAEPLCRVPQDASARFITMSALSYVAQRKGDAEPVCTRRRKHECRCEEACISMHVSAHTHTHIGLDWGRSSWSFGKSERSGWLTLVRQETSWLLSTPLYRRDHQRGPGAVGPKESAPSPRVMQISPSIVRTHASIGHFALTSDYLHGI